MSETPTVGRKGGQNISASNTPLNVGSNTEGKFLMKRAVLATLQIRKIGKLIMENPGEESIPIFVVSARQLMKHAQTIVKVARTFDLYDEGQVLKKDVAAFLRACRAQLRGKQVIIRNDPKLARRGSGMLVNALQKKPSSEELVATEKISDYLQPLETAIKEMAVMLNRLVKEREIEDEEKKVRAEGEKERKRLERLKKEEEEKQKQKEEAERKKREEEERLRQQQEEQEKERQERLAREAREKEEQLERERLEKERVDEEKRKAEAERARIEEQARIVREKKLEEERKRQEEERRKVEEERRLKEEEEERKRQEEERKRLLEEQRERERAAERKKLEEIAAMAGESAAPVVEEVLELDDEIAALERELKMLEESGEDSKEERNSESRGNQPPSNDTSVASSSSSVSIESSSSSNLSSNSSTSSNLSSNSSAPASESAAATFGSPNRAAVKSAPGDEKEKVSVSDRSKLKKKKSKEREKSSSSKTATGTERKKKKPVDDAAAVEEKDKEKKERKKKSLSLRGGSLRVRKKPKELDAEHVFAAAPTLERPKTPSDLKAESAPILNEKVGVRSTFGPNQVKPADVAALQAALPGAVSAPDILMKDAAVSNSAPPAPSEAAPAIPTESEDPAVLKARKKKIEYERAMQEILDSERLYFKNLQYMMWGLMKPLKEHAQTAAKPVVSEKEVNTLFSNIEGLVNFNKQLLRELEAKQNEPFETRCIGNIFVTLSPLMRLYTDYVNKYDNAMKCMIACSQREEFNRLVEKCLQDCGGSNLLLNAYLIMPVQRLPRYEMLLKALLKLTPDTHPDFQSLTKAVAFVTEINGIVNTKKRTAEKQEEMMKICEQIVGCDVPLVQPHRLFVREGILEWGLGTNTKTQKKREKAYFFLFNDVLVRTKQKGKVKHTYEYQETFQLGHLYLRDIKYNPFTMSEKEKFVFKLVRQENEKEGYTFFCSTEAEKVEWVVSVEEAIRLRDELEDYQFK